MYTSKILTVSGLNMYVKSIIDSDENLNNIFIEGEISNLNRHYKSGHMYFSLKDAGGIVKAVMFAQSACRLRFNPCEGMKVICRARLSVYEATGQYQLYVEDMQPDGVGSIAVAFEQLKKKLQLEGLFDKARKKPIPDYPEKIGVITSPTGAAIRDIYSILERRYPLARIISAYVTVQGENAAKELTKAVNDFNRKEAADVIIIGRGGGSLEDLQAFNDEALARAIAASKIPVISAVGHETDFTICDFVSDLRAPTPSAAAELAVPDIQELKEKILSYYVTLKHHMNKILVDKENQLNEYTKRIEYHSPQEKLKLNYIQLDALSSRLKDSFKLNVSDKGKQLLALSEKLNVLNPMNVLLRGYSIAYKDGHSINSIKDICKGDKTEVILSDGTLKCTVDELERKI